jgi:hypothetical protein
MAFEKPGRYTEKDREKISADDFAGPERSFPIVIPKDVEDAARLHGQAADPEAVKRRIIAIAKRKGKKFVKRLPSEWRADTMEMAELGGRWVEVFSVGRHIDNQGRTWDIEPTFIEQAVINYDTAIHEAPAVIGHPENDAPAYGWAKRLRVRGDVLEARFGEVDSEFEQMVRDGRFKKRSASFYLDPKTAPGGRAPYLRHVGFLGAQLPAIKGLRDIQFSEGDALTFEIQLIQFSEDETMDEKQQQSMVQKIVDGIKSAFSGSAKEGAQASFTEADLKARLEEMLKPVTASFNEKITALETQNKDLLSQVQSQSTKATRAEMAQFLEGLGQAKLPDGLLAGIGGRDNLISFLEMLPDGGDRKLTVVEFSEKNGAKVETKTEMSPLAFMKKFLSGLGPFISFGEQFGGLKPVGEDAVVEFDEGRLNSMRDTMGIKKAETGGAK